MKSTKKGEGGATASLTASSPGSEGPERNKALSTLSTISDCCVALPASCLGDNVWNLLHWRKHSLAE